VRAVVEVELEFKGMLRAVDGVPSETFGQGAAGGFEEFALEARHFLRGLGHFQAGLLEFASQSVQCLLLVAGRSQAASEPQHQAKGGHDDAFHWMLHVLVVASMVIG
jgi:hypothetical protein